jgi:hypothetical protein
MSTPDKPPFNPEAAVAALVAGGFTREAAEAIVAEYGDVIEVPDDDLDITVEGEP